MMKKLLALAALSLLFAVPGAAQNEGNTPSPADTARTSVDAATVDAAPAAAEPGFLDKGGAIDEVFGTLLGWCMYVPFFDLTMQSEPPYPWVAANGAEIDKAIHDEIKLAWGQAGETGAILARYPQPWTVKATTEELTLTPQGNPVVVKLPFVVIWLVVASLFFTFMMRFVNLRLFRHAIRVVAGKYDCGGHAGEVTHFQALASALSATVGLGNIAGVAIAISLGGPGATIWMIAAGLLGMTLKFTECTLGQKYREIDAEGRVLGGPMRYLARGLKEKGLGGLGMTLSIMFAVFCIGGSLAGGNSFQVSQALSILRAESSFIDANSWVFGLVMAVLVGVVIIGGIKRIASTASRIVPLMCLIYVTGCILVLVANAGQIPEAFGTMFSSAFTGDAIYGGAIGSLVMGFQRAAFSNEAGVGSASIAHSAAKTEYPVREGVVALLEPFIDTVVVCTMTALVIVITGVYATPETAAMVANKEGAALTQYAFRTVPFMAAWFPYVLLAAVVMFAFSTMISWSYYGERCWTQLFGQRTSIIYKVLFLVFTVLGSIIGAANVLDFGDLMILVMAFPNIVGLYILGGGVKQDLEEYERMLDSGEFDAGGSA